MDPAKLGREFLSPPPQNAEGDPGEEVNITESVRKFEDANLEMNSEKEMKDMKDTDLEKAVPEPFDMKAFFEDSVRNRLAAGGKLKKMSVVVDKLTVTGQGAAGTQIPDNLSPLIGLAKLFWPPSWINRNKGKTTFKILDDVSTFCKEGEMLLVLGRPGAGCSSFLRVVANQRKMFVKVEGDVSYGGISAKNFKKYLGEVIYAPEEDAHFATLTVRQTLDFALRMKTPAHLETTKKRLQTDDVRHADYHVWPHETIRYGGR